MVKKLNFLFDRWIVLNFGPSCRAYFSLQNDSLWAKIEVKTDEISPKIPKTLIKTFTFFLGGGGTSSFLLDFAQ